MSIAPPTTLLLLAAAAAAPALRGGADVKPGWTRIGGRPPPRSALDELVARPTTLLLLLVNLGAFARLRSRDVAPSAVGLSAHALWHDRQYARLVTSTFAHFDAMHLLFNASSTYSLGALEDVLGSGAYLLATLFLVPATGLLSCVLAAAASRLDGDVSRLRVPAVGFSGVLFALVVVATLRSPSYCVVPGVETTCFATRRVLFLRVNAAPFVLAGLVQAVVPRASFLGHLAGILLGFPAAWLLGT